MHEQLEQALREWIRSGQLLPDTRLPSSRALARQLGTSRGVVVEAYAQLTAEGYLRSGQGAPTRVASTAVTERPPLPASTLAPSRPYDFDPELPDLAAFPREEWLRSARSALRRMPFAALGPGDVRGSAELRNRLMAYLGRVRSATPEPEHTLISGGFAHGFATLCRVLRDRGIEHIALQEPGPPAQARVAAATGLQAVPVALDGEGLVIDSLARSNCEVVVVTPAHQYPTGGVLSPQRRAALLEWAEDEDALIVEEDHDSELRYDRVAVGSLQGLAPERVCQIGSFSLRLAPGLRMGWMLSPSWLTGALTYELGLSAGSPPAVDQLTLADFLGRGELDRHLRRMRGRYRARREALVAALARHLPAALVVGIAAGTFAPVMLDGAPDPGALVGSAAAVGVGLRAAQLERPALVLGFANLAAPAIERGIALLAEAVQGTPGGGRGGARGP